MINITTQFSFSFIDKYILFRRNTMTKSHHLLGKAWLIVIGIVFNVPTMAFDSGSNEADGAFNPIVNTTVQLPPDGIFNYTSVNIPSGVIVRFTKNAANTPVTMLASGNVTINGTIGISGAGSAASGTASGGNLGDDGLPGQGGVGGFAGGRGGDVNSRGGNGLGPGAGVSGPTRCGLSGIGGSGAGYASTGGSTGTRNANAPFCIIVGGPTYGSSALLPLIGGSGGGGGHGGGTFSGTGGGGGGGAILIAASGTVRINGSIVTYGGRSGESIGTNCGGTGGGGSGGAIRIVATTLAGNGTISALGGAQRSNVCASGNVKARGGAGASGRIRLEAETMLRTAATTPGFSFAQPGDIFVAGLPGLSITSVAGVSAPAQPTGSADIVLPEDTPNPVEVIFATTDVPLGNTITLKITPATGASSSVISDALIGTDANGTASASINLPSGPSVLSARVSFTVTAALGNALSTFAQGEQVERVVLAANMNGPSMTTLITVSGKEYTLPSNRVPIFKRTL
jgi:hypothetical protein